MSNTSGSQCKAKEETVNLSEKSWWDDKHVVLDLYGEVLEVLDELDY